MLWAGKAPLPALGLAATLALLATFVAVGLALALSIHRGKSMIHNLALTIQRA